MDLKERGPRQRRSFDDSQEPRRSFGHGREPRRSFDDGREPRRSFDDGRERTVRWPPACRPAPELQREMDAALAEVGVSTGPTPDRSYQQRQHKAFEVVRKIRSRSPDRPPGRRFG
jgi:hypothetical protein